MELEEKKNNIKKFYFTEIILAIIQAGIFYVIPYFVMKNTVNGLEIVVILLLLTFLLGIANGLLIETRFKFLFPVFAAAAFIPSVYIWYNESALIHALWYLCMSLPGTLSGCGFKKYLKNTKKRLE